MNLNECNHLLMLRLKGGLGNQLFQIAYLYSLVDANVVHSHKIDCTYYSNALPEVVLCSNEQKHTINNYIFCFYVRNMCKVFGTSFCLKLIPRGRYFRLKLIRISYLEGYWQDFSWANIAKSRLTAICNSVVSRPSVQGSIATSLQITPEAICVHVRMGDYLSPSNLQRYRRLSSSYYKLSVQRALSQGASSVIYLFSDEPVKARDLVTESLQDLVTINIVELKDYTAFETIAWMSMFKYIVTANSTFSAWAAWFSQAGNRVKYISSPSRWFNKNFAHLEPNLPISWDRN